MSTESNAVVFSAPGTIKEEVGLKQYEHEVLIEMVVTPKDHGMGADVRATFEVDKKPITTNKFFFNNKVEALSWFVNNIVVTDLFNKINNTFYRHGEEMVKEYKKFVDQKIGEFHKKLDAIRLP